MRKVAQRFKQVFTHEAGYKFNATLQPIRDMKIYSDDFFPVRQILRTFYSANVKSGDVVQERGGQRYLLGDYDYREGLYTGFRVFPVNKSVKWTRQVTTIDPLTQEPWGTNEVEMGNIWVTSEVLSREERGSHILTREEVRRVLTGAPVQENDLLDGQVVKEVVETLGIRVLEVV